MSRKQNSTEAAKEAAAKKKSAKSKAKAKDDAQEKKASPGRPRLCDEELRVVAFKLPVSMAQTFDDVATAHGQTRSVRLRALVENDIAKASSAK